MVALAKVERQDVGSLLKKGHKKMDEKKVREAIEIIKSNYPTSGYYMLCEALDIAVEVLEKQLPKKPIEHPAKFAPFYECPSCGNMDVYGQKKCDHCGQRLDWSE